MLTRLEAHGFKNLLDFSVDLGPYHCLAGPNGVGKSNFFDAIRFLSLLTDQTLPDAALAVRGGRSEGSDPLELFWSDGEERVSELRLAAEMLVEPEVVDDFGRSAQVSATHLRYEIVLGYETLPGNGHLGHLVLRSERLSATPTSPLRFAHHPELLKAVGPESTGIWLSTHAASDGPAQIHLHDEDGSDGGREAIEASKASRTLLASVNTTTRATLLAARREMQSWRALALEPSALRSPDSFHADPHLGIDGSHLPATLHRLISEAGEPALGEQLCARLATRLASLVSARGIRVDVDEARRLLTLEVREAGGGVLPARALSDGTLRFLALSVLSEDPSFRGLLCIEEPENGIHPSRAPAMVELLGDLPSDVIKPEHPLRQVLVASHSSTFVQLQEPETLLLATSARLRGPFARPAQALRCRRLAGTRAARESPERGAGMASLLAYLSNPSEAKVQLPAMFLEGGATAG
jgi:predicted ATPase